MMNPGAPLPRLREVPDAWWSALAEKRIYFGHQSVGFDILKGVGEVVDESPRIPLRIVEAHEPLRFEKPVFAHSALGANMDPRSKIDAFSALMEKKGAAELDIAFFKFCYVDVQPGTDVQRLFESYRDAVERLKKARPRTTFLHVTTPLTSLQTGPKAWVKRWMGKPLRGFEDNVRREELNALIRREWGAEGLVFDLAKIESILPDGSVSRFEKEGKLYPALAADYTDDGGHLNARGRRVVAEQLLVFLARVAGRLPSS